MDRINFDEWAKLYETNPVEFERRRAEFLAEQIDKAPITIRNHLRLIQLQCDTVRAMYPPLEATIKILELTVEKMRELKTNLTILRARIEDAGQEDTP